MRVSEGRTLFLLRRGVLRYSSPAVTHRKEGASSVNDMKDMLANLPQYQEQREKVSL